MNPKNIQSIQEPFNPEYALENLLQLEITSKSALRCYFQFHHSDAMLPRTVVGTKQPDFTCLSRQAGCAFNSHHKVPMHNPGLI
ncbi:MAG: hypothetical protein WD048_12035 [Chitinophagales bacterium]